MTARIRNITPTTGPTICAKCRKPIAYSHTAGQWLADGDNYCAAPIGHTRHAPVRCPQHPAFDADYCPVCGTDVVIGGTR
jgi:hypothetical protein